jgi:DNA-binding FadR family transcriptional regulator
MAKKRIRRESVSDQVFAQLRDGILGGAMPAGAEPAGERDLAEEFGPDGPLPGPLCIILA